MITISYDVENSDALALSLEYYRHSPTVRKQRAQMQMLLAVGLALFTLTASWGEAELSPAEIGILAFWGFGVLRYPKWHNDHLRKSAESLLAESSYQAQFGRVTLAMSENGIASKSAAGESSYPWKAVDRVALTPEHLFVFLGGPSGHAIRRSEVGEEMIQQVMTFVEIHMPEGAAKITGKR